MGGPNWYQNRDETCYIPKLCTFYVKKMIMLTGVKTSSLGCKCVFNRQDQSENNSKSGSLHGMKF